MVENGLLNVKYRVLQSKQSTLYHKSISVVELTVNKKKPV